MAKIAHPMAHELGFTKSKLDEANRQLAAARAEIAVLKDEVARLCQHVPPEFKTKPQMSSQSRLRSKSKKTESTTPRYARATEASENRSDIPKISTQHHRTTSATITITIRASTGSTKYFQRNHGPVDTHHPPLSPPRGTHGKEYHESVFGYLVFYAREEEEGRRGLEHVPEVIGRIAEDWSWQHRYGKQKYAPPVSLAGCPRTPPTRRHSTSSRPGSEAVADLVTRVKVDWARQQLHGCETPYDVPEWLIETTGRAHWRQRQDHDAD